jgi:hypothetical protein
MITRRKFLAGSGCAIAALGASVRAASSPPLTLMPLAPNVWRHISWHVFPNGTAFPSNGLVVKGKRRVLIIDTTWMTHDMEALLSQVRLVTGDLPRLLVPTPPTAIA